VKTCKLVIHDEVNVSFDDLEPMVRRKCHDALKHFLPHARHTPAFKLGRWDGTVSLFAINGNTYVNMLDRVLPIIMDSGYEIDIEDKRIPRSFIFPDIDEEYCTNFMPNSVWPKGHPAAGQPIMLRDYQVQIIKTFLENPQSLQEIATGAGKTLLTATLSHLCEAYGRTLVIVPNKSLVEQTEKDYKNLGLDVGVYYGDRKDIGKTHTICTWQSLDRIAKGTAGKTKTSAVDFADFIEDVVCIMIDEAHQAKADVLKNMMAGAFANIPIRWGLTGTIPKEPHAADTILSSIGPVVNKLAAKELMDRGVLSKCNVDILQLLDTAEFASFHEEYEFLTSDRNKLEWLAGFVQETRKTGNTLVLVNRVATGKELQDMVPDCEFISGGVKSSERNETYDNAAFNDNMAIVATYGVAAVGINIPRIFNLILIEPGKSFVRVIQSIGRGIRTAQDKDFVQIFDITSTCKFSAAHMKKRKSFYKDAEYPHQVRKVDYLRGEMLYDSGKK
jgi:superfamily II DNA or RNA helicase